MLKTISTSDLRAKIKRVLNEVVYGGAQYVVERSGEPAAAIISLEDLHLLQDTKRQLAQESLRETLAGVQERGNPPDSEQLDERIEDSQAAYSDPVERALKARPQEPRKWRELRGRAPHPLAGEDAQAWVSRTRREADEGRQTDQDARHGHP